MCVCMYAYVCLYCVCMTPTQGANMSVKMGRMQIMLHTCMQV